MDVNFIHFYGIVHFRNLFQERNFLGHLEEPSNDGLISEWLNWNMWKEAVIA
jgi:uncharacterized lipoprotein